MKKSEINILIVDDEESVRRSLTEAVSRAGYSALDAGGADEALSLSKIKPVNGAIIDCMLPMVNGVELAKDLLSHLPTGAPLTLMSGIFKDRGFAAESMKKTGAQSFLEKPIKVDDYISYLDEQFAPLIDQPKVALHALLATPFASNRQRRKALDHVEEMKGYDLPFVLCILMDAESSGYLNLYSDSGEIFGFTIVKGCLCRVDCSGSESAAAELLVKGGYAPREEIENFRKDYPKGDLIDGMINLSLLSPHVSEIVKKQQMVEDLKKLVTSESLKINFAPDRKVEMFSPNITLGELTPDLHHIVNRMIPHDFLQSFYGGWNDYPILKGPAYSGRSSFNDYTLVKSGSKFIDEIGKGEKTISQLMELSGLESQAFYKSLHFAALRRLIVFSEEKVGSNIDEYVRRIGSILEAIKEKNPVEIFKYFGANDEAKPSNVERIYRDFAKANHPDLMPRGATEVEISMNHQLFSLVSEAQSVLVDPGKREKYFDSQKQKSAQNQIAAEDHYVRGVALVNKKQFTEALKAFEEAEKMYPCDDHKMGVLWGKLKEHPEWGPNEVKKQLSPLFNAIDAKSNRKSGQYHFVKGLYEKGLGQIQQAAASFSMSLDLDANLLEPRRELSMLKGRKKKDKTDITGDLTGLISNFFKKKG